MYPFWLWTFVTLLNLWGILLITGHQLLYISNIHMFDGVFFLHYQNKSEDKQLCFLRVHQAGFTVLQTSTEHHADFTVEKPSVYEVSLQSSFHFSDHKVQSMHSLSCCAPNFDLYLPTIPSDVSNLTPHLSPNGSVHQSLWSLCLSVRPIITLHLNQWETLVSCN